MDAARADLQHWVTLARTEIAALPDVPARAALRAVSDFVADRTG
jgi:heptaprenyl diphosphate synthase